MDERTELSARAEAHWPSPNTMYSFWQTSLSWKAKIVEEAGRIDRYQAWSLWTNGPWGERVDSEIDSIFQ